MCAEDRILISYLAVERKSQSWMNESYFQYSTDFSFLGIIIQKKN